MIEKDNSKIKVFFLPAIVLATSYHYSIHLMWGIIIGYILCRLYCQIFLEKGFVGHVMIDLGQWKIHLHHWIMGIGVLALVWAVDYFYLPAIFTGFICGIILQGIYDYSNWHKVIIKKEDYKK